MGESGKKEKKRFDGNYWYMQQMDRRTREVIRSENEAFEREHAADSNAALLRTVSVRARALGYPPQMCEVAGAKLIAERFGNWTAVLRALGYSHPAGSRKLDGSRRYKEEYARQQALYRAERREKGRILARQRRAAK